MEARTSVAGSPGSEEITRSPDHSDVNDLEGKPGLKVLRKSMLGWIFRIEKGDLDGLKIVPPLEIILVPGVVFHRYLHSRPYRLIGRAWYPNRLVPWIAGFVEVETYLGYLEEFFHLNHGALPTLDVAIDQCLEMENKLVNSRAADPCDEESSLSEGIMSRIEEIKARQDSMSKEESCLAASGFMCITAEAMVMSELTDDDLSNWVRRCALDLMVDKGSGYAAVSTALLGMATEAKLMIDFLKRDQDDNSYLHSEFSTCCTVRTRTLALFTILQKSDALGFVGEHDRGVATSPDVLDTRYKSDTDQVKMDKRGTDVASGGKKDRGVASSAGALETRYNSDTDQVKMDKKGTGVASAGKKVERLKVDVPPGNIHRGKNSSEIKKMNGIRKTKAFIKSLLPKRMKRKSTQV